MILHQNPFELYTVDAQIVHTDKGKFLKRWIYNGFSFLFFLWLAWNLHFFICKRNLSIVENIILYLLILIIHINWNWLIFEEFAFLKYSHDSSKYISILINRSIVTP